MVSVSKHYETHRASKTEASTRPARHNSADSVTVCIRISDLIDAKPIGIDNQCVLVFQQYFQKPFSQGSLKHGAVW